MSDEILNEDKAWDLIVSCEGIKEGHFYYTWEYHTKYIIDIDKIFQWPENVEKIGESIYIMYKDKDIDYIITANHRSGLLLSHDVGERFNVPVILVKRLRGVIDISSISDVRGKALIIDDGINTGNTIKQLLKMLSPVGIEIVGVGVFINRYTGDLQHDFKNLVRYILDLPEDFHLVHIDKCPYCKRQNELVRELQKIKDINKKRIIQQEIESLKPVCAYQDVQWR